MRVFSILFLCFLFFISCIKEEPDNIDITRARELYKTGSDYFDSGNYKKAIEYFNRSIELNDSNSFCYLKRGDAFRKLRNPQNAIRDYDKVLELKPSNAKALYHRGTLKIKLGKKSEGCSDIEKAKGLCYKPAEEFFRTYCK